MLKHLHFNTVVGTSSTTPSDYAILGEVKGAITRVLNGPAGPTVDVTIRTKGEGPPSYPLLALVNVADGVAYHGIAVAPKDAAGAAITGAAAPPCVSDKLEVVVAQGDGDCEVEVWVFYEAPNGA
jgi:hypothetical protein